MQLRFRSALESYRKACAERVSAGTPANVDLLRNNDRLQNSGRFPLPGSSAAIPASDISQLHQPKLFLKHKVILSATFVLRVTDTQI